MSNETNKAWNLKPGDGLQYACSSFTINEGQYAEIAALNLCGDEKIFVIKIIRPPLCSDMDAIGVITPDCCGVKAALTRSNSIGRIGEFGEYIVAREVDKRSQEPFSPQADVRVTRFTLKKGMAPLENKGFCPC